MLPFSIDQVIEMAATEADRLIKIGKLIPMKADYNFLEDEEAQTINSVFNLYKEFVMTKDQNEIYNELYHRYHNYF